VIKQGRTILATDFQSLSLFRIFFAAYLLGDFYVHVPFFADLYGDDGILPLDVLAAEPLAGIAVISPILHALEKIGVQAIFPILYPAALVAFGLGWRTRWTTSTVFLLNSYLFWRNPYVRNGAEYLAHLLLLWCLFLPMARYWSVDAALDPGSRERGYPVLPFLAIRLQIGSLYFFAGILKLASPPWLDGHALAWSLQDNIFGARSAGLLLVHHFSGLLYASNYAVIAFQLAFPFLIYCPWRNSLTRGFALTVAALTHVSFIFCLTVGGFPYLCLIMLLLLVPDAWVTHLLRERRDRLGRVAIFYEPDCGFCKRVSLLLREFLLSPTTQVRPASDDSDAMRLLVEKQSWVVRDFEGTFHLKWRAMTFVLGQNPLAAPLGWLSDLRFLRRPLDRLYDFIGRHRRRLGAVAKVLMPIWQEQPIRWPAQALCGVLAGLALLTNISSVERPAIDAFGFLQGERRPIFGMPHWFFELVVDLQVWQEWPLFVPPPHWQRDYQITSRMADGTSVDLMERLPVPLFRADPDGRLEFANDRWLKYFTQFHLLSGDDWLAFGRYLCRQAIDRIAALPAVHEIDIVSLTRAVAMTPADGAPPDQNRRFICASDVNRRIAATSPPTSIVFVGIRLGAGALDRFW
jgi:PAS domain-containing protein